MRLVYSRGKWHAYERVDGKPKRISLGTADREVAQRRLIELEERLREKPVTIAGMYATYFEEHGPRIVNQKALQLCWKRLEPVFGHLRPDQVSRALTRAYTAKERRRGVGDASIRRDLGVISAVIRYSLGRQATVLIERPSAPPPKTLYLSRAEFEALLAATRSYHIRLFIILAHATAGRAAAVLELTWDRVDFERGLIDLRDTKASPRRKPRAVVPMTGRVRAALLEAREMALTDYVIEYAGRRVLSVDQAFKRTARAAGMPWCSPHVLRHTAAVHMAEAGVSMSEISQFLGHSSTSVTERVYARFSPDYLRRAAGALE